MTNGFPELTDSYLAGQDILYQQFNEIQFYVEDTKQEHFYYNVLKKIFFNIKFEKIFPLNGKKNVKDAAKENIENKQKIYIVDLDFDALLNIKEKAPNLFYLNRYSIENYLLCKQGIFELIRERHPKLKNRDIESIFNYQKLISECKILTELACAFILIQKYSLGEEYFGMNPNRDFDFATPKPKYKNNFIISFFNTIELALKTVNRKFTLKGQIKSLKSHFKSIQNALENIPGKYLLNLVKCRLEHHSLIWQVNLESFTYKLSKEIDIQDLKYLQVNISNYIK